jgi:hypothetical protein
MTIVFGEATSLCSTVILPIVGASPSSTAGADAHAPATTASTAAMR